MTSQIFGLSLVSVVLAIDNALLAGMVLPWTSREHKTKIITVVGIILGMSQIVLAIGVGQLLTNLLFRVLAILILVWMSIRTIAFVPPSLRCGGALAVVWRVFVYTVFGNLDNMIRLGSELRGQYLWLVFFSTATIPLFIVVAIFLSDQCEKHHWILVVGSTMMAWAAAGLIAHTPGWRMADQYVSFPIEQILICVAIVGAGYVLRILYKRTTM
ncbi:hypothetical protein [Alicyclobacillus macrosporangiidus]|uniref:hypothetical protein n=1 Tax=Alicyclobacillus macrosporangiidus TaxID=392015 RepID=UPI0004965773|nr:hypothetical protein [Alicyclobacillus macrosporangiidus]